MEPTNLPFISDDEATGELAAIYAAYKARTGRPEMPGILKCFSARPDFLTQVDAFSSGLHFADGHLDRRTHEMIATYVSGLNHCPY